jgi:DNA-binding NtrC family response regulator
MKTLSGTILVADDDADIREILRDTLNSLGAKTITAANGQECLDFAETAAPDLILLDIEMPVKNGLDVLKEIHQRRFDTTVIMITAYGTIERAVQAMKEGAYDFITKPFELDHVAVVVEKALERVKLKRGLEQLSQDAGERYRLVGGESPKMRQAIETAKKAAVSSSTVLLLGESGTGKEVFARAIHNWSERKHEPFIAINCVGLSKDLLESELFGHEKGAFTGAHQLKKGKMEQAHGGTVFLDEVGDISAELQTKLLRFLQEREFERVGGTQPIAVDVRVIAATNRDLSLWVAEGRFRDDLYYRLNVFPLEIPPLRSRPIDIPALAKQFLKRHEQIAGRAGFSFTDAALAELTGYDWPGNIRELGNVVQRAMILAPGAEIGPEHLMLPHTSSRLARESARSLGGQVESGLKDIERDTILNTLQRMQGSRRKTAEALMMSERTLRHKLKQYREAGFLDGDDLL